MARPKKQKGTVLPFKQKFDSNFEGFISKIRIDAKTDIPEIIYSNNSEKSDKEVVLKGRAKPLDSFLQAMQNLAKGFCEILEIQDKEENTLITTVNFSEKGGVIISGQISLEKCPTPWCNNTPHVLIENEQGFEVPEYMRGQLDELRRQAVMYINGEAKEKQTTLPLNGTND